MQRLSPDAKTIPIHSAAALTGCGHCHHDDEGMPHCQRLHRAAVEHPSLAGEPALLARLLPALAPVLGHDAGTGAGGLLRALEVTPDEVTLQLALARHCGADEVADSAFHTLRGLLPDTDIYVRFSD